MKRLVIAIILVLMVLPFVGLTSHTVNAQALPVTSKNYTYVPDPFFGITPIRKAAVPQNITPRTITLGAPTDFPKDLDQLYKFVEEGHRGYVFHTCSAVEITAPYLSWNMIKVLMPAMLDDNQTARILLPAKDIAQAVQAGGGTFKTSGTLDVTENAVFGKVMLLAAQGKFLACSPNGDGKPALYGAGAQEFLNWLGGYVK
jgi:hypothetical protein